jgi:hypothetical protein
VLRPQGGPTPRDELEDEEDPMSRALKTIAAALLATLAMGVSSAQAKEFWFKSDGLTVMAGSWQGDQYIFDFGVVNCKKTTYGGTLVGPETGFLMLATEYDDCSYKNGTVEIHMNDCGYSYLQDNNTGEGKFDVITMIECGANSEITVTFISAGQTKCVIHIPEQTIGTGAIMTNTGAGGVKHLDVDINFSNIKYSQTAGDGLGKCPTADNTNNGQYSGIGTIIGYDTEAEPTDLWVE